MVVAWLLLCGMVVYVALAPWIELDERQEEERKEAV